MKVKATLHFEGIDTPATIRPEVYMKILCEPSYDPFKPFRTYVKTEEGWIITTND